MVCCEWANREAMLTSVPVQSADSLTRNVKATWRSTVSEPLQDVETQYVSKPAPDRQELSL